MVLSKKITRITRKRLLANRLNQTGEKKIKNGHLTFQITGIEEYNLSPSEKYPLVEDVDYCDEACAQHLDYDLDFVTKRKKWSKRYNAFIFGVDLNGESICMNVCNYFPYIYLLKDKSLKGKCIGDVMKDLPFKHKQGICRKECSESEKYYVINGYYPDKFDFFKLSAYTSYTRKSLGSDLMQGSIGYGRGKKREPLTILGKKEKKWIVGDPFDSLPSKYCLFHDYDFSTGDWIEVEEEEIVYPEPDYEFANTSHQFICGGKNTKRIESKNFANFLLMAYDIETMSNDGSFSDPNRGDEIIQISIVFRFFKDQHSILKIILTQKESDVIEDDIHDDGFITTVKTFDEMTEAEIIEAFFLLTKNCDPDFRYGYNNFFFDDVYIFRRSQILGLSDYGDETVHSHMAKMRKKAQSKEKEKEKEEEKEGEKEEEKEKEGENMNWVNLGKVRTEFGFSRLKFVDGTPFKSFTMKSSGRGDNIMFTFGDIGRVAWDVMKLLQRDESQRASFKLNDVAKDNDLGSKVDLPYQEMFKRFRRGRKDDIKLIGVYCIQDSELLHKIVIKKCLIINDISLAGFCYVSTSDLLFRGQSIKSTSRLRARAKYGFNMLILESKPERTRHNDHEKGKYGGGFVFTPHVGQRDVATLDFASLYPSTCRDLNICVSTFMFNALENNTVQLYEVAKRWLKMLEKDKITIKEFGTDKFDNVLYDEDTLTIRGKLVERIANEKPEKLEKDEEEIYNRMKAVYHFCSKQNPEKKDFFEKVLKSLIINKNKLKKLYDMTLTSISQYNSFPELEMEKEWKEENSRLLIFETRIGVYRQARFTTTRRGFLPFAFDEMLDARKAVKGQMKQAFIKAKETNDPDDWFYMSVLNGRQLAIKTTQNSVYGQLGSEFSPVRCIPVAASITQAGQQFIKYTKFISEKDHRGVVRYGDTDSVFVEYPHIVEMVNKKYKNISKSQVKEFRKQNPKYQSKFDYPASQIKGKIKQRKMAEEYFKYGDICAEEITHKIRTNLLGMVKGTEEYNTARTDMENEQAKIPCLLIKKKGYVAIGFEPNDLTKEIYVNKGISLKKRDYCKFLKIVYQGVFDLMIGGGSKKSIFRNIVRFMVYMFVMSLQNRIPPEYFVITKSIKDLSSYKPASLKSMSHIGVAMKMAERDPSNAPKANDRVHYAFIRVPLRMPGKIEGTTKNSDIKDVGRTDDIGYIIKEKLPIHHLIYFEKQIKNNICELLPAFLGKVKDAIAKHWFRPLISKIIEVFFEDDPASLDDKEISIDYEDENYVECRAYEKMTIFRVVEEIKKKIKEEGLEDSYAEFDDFYNGAIGSEWVEKGFELDEIKKIKTAETKQRNLKEKKEKALLELHQKQELHSEFAHLRKSKEPIIFEEIC
jgi:DNA polymerase elongation subunit (family B)